MTIVQAPRAVSTTAPPRASRDTGVDFLRALCVLGVVLLHAIMVGVTVGESGPVFDNASDETAWIAPLSWFLQVMPLFFVIGGFSGLLAYQRMRQRGGTAIGFVAGRVHRLLRPAILTIAVIGLALALLTVSGVPADLIATAGFRYGQPLWFLGSSSSARRCSPSSPPLMSARPCGPSEPWPSPRSPSTYFGRPPDSKAWAS